MAKPLFAVPQKTDSDEMKALLSAFSGIGLAFVM